MVLQMKVEAVNFRKNQEISLSWLDSSLQNFEINKRGGANRSPLGRIGLKKNISGTVGSRIKVKSMPM